MISSEAFPGALSRVSYLIIPLQCYVTRVKAVIRPIAPARALLFTQYYRPRDRSAKSNISRSSVAMSLSCGEILNEDLAVS